MIAPILLLSLLHSSPNTLAASERAAGWRLLFDGRTFAGWRGLGYDTVPTSHWAIVDGAIKKIANGDVPRAAGGPPLHRGYLMSVGAFGNFEVTGECKVTARPTSVLQHN